MASVSLNYSFSGGTEQNTEIVVLGESSTGLPNVDSTVAVDVTVAELNSILTVTSEGTAVSSTTDVTDNNKPYPGLSFKLSDAIKTKVELVATTATAISDVLTSNNFDSWLARIPHEAIKSVTPGAVETGFGEMFDEIAVPAGAAKTDNDKQAAVQNMFEQVLASGRIDPLDMADRTSATKFVADDTITVYIAFTVSKSRTYKIDSSVATDGTATATFRYENLNNVLTGNTTIECDDNPERAQLVAYVLTAVADS